jgi:hypothetical protein
MAPLLVILKQPFRKLSAIGTGKDMRLLFHCLKNIAMKINALF